MATKAKRPLTYNQAINIANRVGAAKAEGLPLLAITVSNFALVHAVNPNNTYAAAVKKGLDAKAIRDMVKNDLIGFSNLQFDA